MLFERRFAVDRQRHANEFSISIHLLLTFLTQRHFLILHFKNCRENGCALISGIDWVDKRYLRLVNGIQGIPKRSQKALGRNLVPVPYSFGSGEFNTVNSLQDGHHSGPALTVLLREVFGL